jgi:hypothetical protein
MDQKWNKYTYVCSTCDALIEYTLDLSNIPLDLDVTNLTCVCGSNCTLLSVADATIPTLTTQKEEKMDNVTIVTPQVMKLDWVENDVTTTKEYTESDVRHMVWTNKNLTNKQNEWYRKESQLRTLLEEVFVDSEDQESLTAIAEIFDVPLTKEVEYTAWVRVDLTVEVELGGDLDSIEDMIAQNLTVDSYDSSIQVTNHDVDRVEEGAY